MELTLLQLISNHGPTVVILVVVIVNSFQTRTVIKELAELRKYFIDHLLSDAKRRNPNE